MFAYCNNNPIKYRDSSGGFPLAVPVAKAVIAGISSATVSFLSTTLSDQIAGEETNYMEAILWAISDGVFAGLSAFCMPISASDVRLLLVTYEILSALLKGEDLWEVAVSLGIGELFDMIPTGNSLFMEELVVPTTGNVTADFAIDSIKETTSIEDETAPTTANTAALANSPAEQVKASVMMHQNVGDAKKYTGLIPLLK